MEMFYQPDSKVLITYTLITDPPEAMYWQTFKIKKSHIKILSKCSRADQARYRQEILTEINKETAVDEPEKQPRIKPSF